MARTLLLKLLLVLTLSLGVPLLFALSPAVQDAASALLVFIRESHTAGMALCVALEALGIMIGVPVSFMNVGVGVIFPFWKAYALTLCACLLGVSSSYLVARFFFSRELHSAVAEKFHIDVDAALRQGPWRFTILVWVLYAPMCLKNYWLASLSIPFHIYLIVAMTNCAAMNALHVFVGSQAGSLIEAWNRGKIPWYDGVIAAVTILLTIGASILLTRFIKASFRASERQIEFQEFGEIV